MTLKLRNSSIAKQVLVRLKAASGELPVSAFFDLLKSKTAGNPETCLVRMCNRIIDAKLICIEGTIWKMTLRGYKHLSGKRLAADITQKSIAPGRVARPFRALRLTQPRPPYRDGAFDHMLIPSRYGRIRQLPCGEVVE